MIKIETESQIVITDRYSLYQGECLEVMDKLIEQGVKVDAIITDPPYGTTACKWDSIIPFNRHIEIENNHGKKQIMYENDYILQQFKTTNKSYQYILDKFNEQAKDGMWERLNKLIKSNGAIVLFGSEPFSSALRMSNLNDFRYDWYWIKNTSCDFIMAKNKPMNRNENILVFSKGKFGIGVKNKMVYNPQGLTNVNKIIKGTNVGGGKDQRPNRKLKEVEYTQEFTNYPKNILEFNKDKETFHPTQKPILLMEYLIKTYTLENEVILDFTMGSGSTGVGCIKTDRKFIGIEKDNTYFNISKERIKNT